jgi:hypothetical protein
MEGRTKRNRERMRDALAQPVPSSPPWLSPFPVREQDDPEVVVQRV